MGVSRSFSMNAELSKLIDERARELKINPSRFVSNCLAKEFKPKEYEWVHCEKCGASYPDKGIGCPMCSLSVQMEAEAGAPAKEYNDKQKRYHSIVTQLDSYKRVLLNGPSPRLEATINRLNIELEIITAYLAKTEKPEPRRQSPIETKEPLVVTEETIKLECEHVES